MDLFGFLRGLGGGQQSAASSEQIPASIRRPADQQEAAPAADPFRLRDAPATQWSPPAWSAPAPAPQQQNQGWNRPINFSPPPADAPQPVNFQQPVGDGLSVAKWQGEVATQQEEKKAADQRSKFFGDEGEYAPQEMSVDAYLNLPPQQRAAVDANTALVEAAKQDTAAWNSSKTIDDKNYLSQVNKAFGDTGGSDTYAPRTMAVLEDLGLNLQGKDLDQYLNYSALVTADDLKALAPGTAAPADDPRQQNAVAFAQAASKRLSETLASGQNLLDSIRTGSDTGAQLFGKPATTAPVGFSNSERDSDLAQAFDILSQTRSQQDLTPETVSGLYAELQQKHGVTPNEVAQYFETRLQSNEYLNAAGDQNVALGGPGSSLEYLAPKDFRSKFLKEGA